MAATIPWPRLRTLLLGLLCLCADNALAAEVRITARVENDRIVNTTPASRFCSSWNLCTRSTVDVPFELTKAINLSSSDPRDRVYVHLPSLKAFNLTNTVTHQSATVQLSYSFISQKVSYQTQEAVGFNVWGGCLQEGSLQGGPGFSKFLWRSYSSTAQQPCMSGPTPINDDIQQSVINEMMLAYNIDFPPVTSLGPGRWEGFIDYPVGQPGGFDFGNMLQPSADTIRFYVEIEVQHDMKVDMPASGGEVEVVPPGGWQQYETSNQTPPRLFHDAPLSVWASSPFSIYMECEHRPGGNQCAMRRPGSTVNIPVSIALTLPGMFNHNGQPVSRLPVGVDRRNAKIIAVAGNVSNQPGQVHFDVQQRDIRQMLNNRGAKYQGGITLIFDANP